ncbi:hypothetical protein OE88DRAFT_1668472 [Heliocybe sulcata]|uniref:Uncharacterized protein n=1 Tax=Heliocybe sulcata TaxID=5364 RepID=A0A5C3MKT1_9AGAM|nr:hypothetical protein OE88DRAFT_1668472 [Heliocybe sulcata]
MSVSTHLISGTPTAPHLRQSAEWFSTYQEVSAPVQFSPSPPPASSPMPLSFNRQLFPNATTIATMECAPYSSVHRHGRQINQFFPITPLPMCTRFLDYPDASNTQRMALAHSIHTNDTSGVLIGTSSARSPPLPRHLLLRHEKRSSHAHSICASFSITLMICNLLPWALRKSNGTFAFYELISIF